MPGGSGRAAEGGRGDPSVVGRRVATWVYWFLVVFVITSGVRSVLAQVFFPPPVAASSQPCADALDRLHAALRDNAITGRSRLAAPGEARAWRRAYRAAEPTCRDADRERWVALGRMRYALEGLLTRYDEEVRPLDERAGPSSATSNPRTNE